MYNRVILIGRLGKDPEVKTTATGKSVAHLTVATSTFVKNSDGTFTENTEWNRIVVWGDQTERCKKMKKGDIVYVEGTLRTNKYTTPEGVDKYSTEIHGVAKAISKGKTESTTQEGQQATDSPTSEDDLPF